MESKNLNLARRHRCVLHSLRLRLQVVNVVARKWGNYLHTRAIIDFKSSTHCPDLKRIHWHTSVWAEAIKPSVTEYKKQHVKNKTNISDRSANCCKTKEWELLGSQQLLSSTPYIFSWRCLHIRSVTPGTTQFSRLLKRKLAKLINNSSSAH